MQLTKEETAKVFALYLCCECSCVYDPPRRTLFLKSVSNDSLWCVLDLSANAGGYNCRFDQVKLLLTPLSAISDEDAIEVAKMWGSLLKDEFKPDYVRRVVKLHSVQIGKWLESWNMFQYFISKGYAVPLFFGINHPANGKTAIELGIAIDKTLILHTNQN